MRSPLLCLAAASALLCLPAVATAQGKNLLFYGNSFSFYNGGVAQVVRAIAEQAGHPTPTIQEQLVSGQDMFFHANDPVQVAAISNSLPAGQTWDHVIMQEISTGATTVLGNPTNMANNAVDVMSNVRAHSPLATGVLYQTWARAPGHSYYPQFFTGPLEMHEQVQAGYRAAVPILEAVHGAGSVVNSAVGDAVALLEFDPQYYDGDLHHPGHPITVLAAMCLYTSLYGERICPIAPDFNQNEPVPNLILGFGLTALDWWRLAGVADRVADPLLRPHPGSGDLLLLETGSSTGSGPSSACPGNPATVGSAIDVRLSSRNGVYDQAPAWLLLGIYPTGQPPMPSAMYPEVAAELGDLGVLVFAMDLQSPIAFGLTLPFTLPGATVMIQGLVAAPSPQTGNSTLTTTDAHEFVFF